jgi:hypothetical protein
MDVGKTKVGLRLVAQFHLLVITDLGSLMVPMTQLAVEPLAQQCILTQQYLSPVQTLLLSLSLLT